MFRRWVIIASGLFLTVSGFAIESGLGLMRPSAGDVAIRAYQGDSEIEIYEYDNRGAGDSELSERFVELGYGITDYFTIMGRIGEMEWDPLSSNGGIYEYGSAWGLGANLGIPVWANDQVSTFVEWGASYNKGDPGSRRRRGGDIFEGEIEWWQTSIGGVCRWMIVDAYAGLRYSQVDLVYTHGSSEGIRRGGLEEDSPVNSFVGLRVNIWNGLAAYIEKQSGSVEGTFYGISYNLPLSLLAGEDE